MKTDADPASVVALSERLLRAVRAGDPTHRIRSDLRGLDREALAGALDDDASRKAFWINVYNAYVQILLEDDPSRYEHKWRFFAADRIPVAGERLSLDDVEHGLLRRSRPKWFLGYVRNPFARGFERRFRVDELDPRIHFALNCGAESCPRIAAYTAGGIDGELETAAESYLGSAVEYDPDAGGRLPGARDGVARVSRLFLWYRGDFGGKAGILETLREYDLIPPDASPWLKYEPYDWSLALGRYREARGDRP